MVKEKEEIKIGTEVVNLSIVNYIDNKFNVLDTKIDDKFSVLDTKIDDKFNVLDTKIDKMYYSMIGVCTTLIVGLFIAIFK